MLQEHSELQSKLDSTISQRLNMGLFEECPVGSPPVTATMTDADKFARFLDQNFCLEILLFWKDVEQYKTLFSEKERVAVGSKVYESFIKPCASRRVNINGVELARVQKECESGEYSENLFDDAQAELYELMRLDHFPRYLEEIEEATVKPVKHEEIAASLQEALQGQDPAKKRHFHRFARENCLEEGLQFWMAVKAYALLFQKSDQHAKAKEIYEQFLGPMAKQQVNVSDSFVNPIREVVETPIKDVEIDNTLFLNVQHEIESLLELDVWSRYVTWCVEDEQAPEMIRQSTSSFLLGDGDIGDRDKMRAAVVELLSCKIERDHFKLVAKDRDCEEAVEFYLELKDYQMLFMDQDMREAARRIWKRYLDDQAERMVNLPASMLKVLRKDILDNDCSTVNANTFDKACRETLALITDNVYPAWAAKRRCESEKRKQGKQTATAQQLCAPVPAHSSCCIIL